MHGSIVHGLKFGLADLKSRHLVQTETEIDVCNASGSLGDQMTSVKFASQIANSMQTGLTAECMPTDLNGMNSNPAPTLDLAVCHNVNVSH